MARSDTPQKNNIHYREKFRVIGPLSGNLIAAIALALGVTCAAHTHASDYPTRPVRIMYGYPAAAQAM